MSDYINVLLYEDIWDEPNTLNRHYVFLPVSYMTEATWERSALSRFGKGEGEDPPSAQRCGRAIVQFCLSGRNEVVWRSRCCKYDMSIDVPVRPFYRNSGWMIKQCQDRIWLAQWSEKLTFICYTRQEYAPSTIMASTRDTPTSESKQSLTRVAGKSSTKKSPELSKVMVDMKDFRQKNTHIDNVCNT